jgi:hypothetical protein
MDISYIEDVEELADQLLYVFEINGWDLVDTEDGEEWESNEFRDRLIHALHNLRADPLAQYYMLDAAIQPNDGSGKLADLMEELTVLWNGYIEHEFPRHIPFDEPELGGRPMAASVGDFLYLACQGAGLKFTNEVFRVHFTEAWRRYFDAVFGEFDEERDDS